jgi:hypothetical protein
MSVKGMLVGLCPPLQVKMRVIKKIEKGILRAA